MPRLPIHERIWEQYSYRGHRAEVWRAFDRILDTDAFLNLGYSPPYLPHFVGSSQRRLAEVVGSGLATRLDETVGVPLLDVGSGRGGPASVLAGSFGFRVTGVDLVPYNVAAARRNASRAGDESAHGGAAAEFVVGDASRLPIATDAMGAAAAIDALVYVPDERVAFEELARVVRRGGVVAISDLLARDEPDEAYGASLENFAEAWDMPGVSPAKRYVADLAAAGFVVEELRDLNPHSVDRFRKWTRLYLAAAAGGGGPIERAMDWWDLDADLITEQVRAAHDALPHLRHALVYARRE